MVIFYATDIYNRATLDINFCKILILLHIADIDLKKSDFDIPEINILLNILDNNLEISKEVYYL